MFVGPRNPMIKGMLLDSRDNHKELNKIKRLFFFFYFLLPTTSASRITLPVSAIIESLSCKEKYICSCKYCIDILWKEKEKREQVKS